MSAIHSNRVTDRTIDNREWGCRECGDINGMGGKLFFTQRFNRSHNNWKIRRLAASHNRIDGDLFNAGWSIVRSDCSQDLLWVTLHAREHTCDPLFGWGNNRQAVCEPACKKGLKWIVLLNIDTLRVQRRRLWHDFSPGPFS